MGAAILGLGLLAGVPCARAQVGERGRITTRSDVKLSVEGVPGTSGKKLAALAATLSGPLASVKSCYAELVKEQPEVVGTLPLELELPEKGKLLVRTSEVGPALKSMRRCIDQAFAKIDVGAVPRPAGARVALELTNSAAGSVDAVRRSEEDASRVDIEEVAGAFRSKGGSTGGEVSFEVTARERALVEQAHKLARDALPGLFDCRRRASKLASPKGAIVLQLQSRGVITVASSTVANERAPTCATGALKRARGTAKPVAELTIRFAP